MTDPAPILVDIDEPVARITINREGRRNALSPEVVAGITVMLNELEKNFDIQVVVLTGAGDAAFCAGADLGGMTAESRVAQHFQRSEVADLFTQMRASRLPIIARANGHALAGGLGLMLACDLVIGVEDVEIGTPEIDLGLWPLHDHGRHPAGRPAQGRSRDDADRSPYEHDRGVRVGDRQPRGPAGRDR